MAEMIEIHVNFPMELKILVPKQLLEELTQVVKEEKISEVITEAITEELKKLRFRKDLEKARRSSGFLDRF
jgi:metal-responsive CopG/Arc/MetJ family transcriptional regulator